MNKYRIAKEIKKFLWLLIKIHIFSYVLRYIVFYLVATGVPELPDLIGKGYDQLLAVGMIFGISLCYWFSEMDAMFDRTYPCYGKDLCEGIAERTYPVKVIKL